MDVAKMLYDLGKMAEEMAKPMTLEEAIEILDISTDPFNQCAKVEMPDSIAGCNAKATKARMIVVEYAKKKLAEDEINGNRMGQNIRRNNDV